MGQLTTNKVCEAYADKGVKITVKAVPGAPDLILFEGDELAFEFLGKLFLAHAKGNDGCGYQIGPKYAGNVFFSKKAKLGIYLHRLPCDNGILTADQSAYKKKKAGARSLG